MKMFPKRGWLPVSLAATIPWACLHAQDSDESDDDIFELSPFTVTSEGDDGYRAQSTTAGSRLNTQLKDVAASVTVLTDAFMDDLGATDVATALSMVAGVETDLTTDQTDLNLGQGFLGGDFNNPNASEGRIRIRGLGRATNSANYLEIFGPLDRFNMERTELLRGPNSLLFGLGEPAGVVNYTPKRANFNKEINKVDIVLDNFGSRRVTFDFGRTLIEDKLAIRVAALESDERYRVKTAEQRNSSLYVTAAFKPFQGTRIDAYVEDISQNGRRPNYRLPQDNVTDWLAEYNRAHEQFSGQELEDYLNDNLVWDASWAITANGQAPRSPDIPFTERELQDTEGNPLVRPGEYRRVMDVRPAGLTAYYTPETGWDTPLNDQLTHLGPRGTTTGDARGGRATNVPWARARFHRSSFGNDRVDRSYVDRQILDESIFPYLDYEMGAFPGSGRSVDSRKLGLTLEHKFNEDLYFSGSYLKEDYEVDQTFAPLAQSHAVSIDINKYLPGSLPNPEDLRGPSNEVRARGLTLDEAVTLAEGYVAAGTNAESNQRFLDAVANRVPNPNYLRPFFHGRHIGNHDTVESEAFLAQLNYDYDFRDKSDRLGFLGKHRMTGFMSGGQRTEHGYRFTSALQYLPGVFDGTNSGLQPAPGTWFTPVWYIGDAIQPGDTASNVTGLPTAVFTGEGRSFDLYGFNDRDSVSNSRLTRGSWEVRDEQVQWRRYTLNPTPELTETKNGAWGASLMSFFWNDRIVTTFGYRKDTVQNDSFRQWDNFRLAPGSNSLDDPVIQERIRRGLIPADITEADLAGNFRRDNFRTTVADISGDGSSIDDFILTDPQLQSRRTVALRTESIVFHATDWLRFFGTRSENFSLTRPTTDGFLRPNPPTSGETDEFGLGMSLLEDKLDLKLTFYETRQQDEIQGNGIRLSQRIPGFEQDIITILRREDQRRANGETTNFDITDWRMQTGTFDENGEPIFASPNVAEVREQRINEQTGLPDVDDEGRPIFEYALEPDVPLNPGTTNDSVSDGWEFDATYNPTKSLRLSFNVSKLENVRTNLERQSIEYVRTRAAFWQPFFDLGYHTNGDTDATVYINRAINNDGTFTVLEEGDAGYVDTSAEGFEFGPNEREADPEGNDTLLIARLYSRFGSELFQAIENDGLPSQGISEYNARLNANYTFRDGRFKGLFVGTNLRWESGKAIGAPLKLISGDELPAGFPDPDLNGNGVIDTLQSEPQVRVQDVANQFKGESVFTGGFRVGYRTKIHGDKVDWRIQLNVDNVFKQGDDLRIIRLNPDRTPVFGINRPTTFKLTNSFNF